MRKLLILPVCLILASACTVTKIAKTSTGWTAYNNSFLWVRSNVAVGVTTNGTVTFSEDSSTPDQKTLGAALGLAQTLASKAP